ncbi:AAA family ATPase [Planomonospora venezuelensis]|uniref:ATPase n=1 Tax=Planomonospora venezuelensis TaxID=1999 RepID=A0A841D4Y1_PLAVE|nr:ATP-binding protein [Planomonospora venezuelensis]MBB5965712.1 hypothetical protein [Planomonospora venezuelensis]GIN04261.1 ArsR family transcriptional regulator [Planomonospora venezuelensis]
MQAWTKPDLLFDRETEWEDLVEFAGNPASGATLALVYGRRRQGKTLLLELLTEAAGGFMFTGLQQSDTQNRADLATAYARHTGLPGAAFGDWREAVDALLRLGEGRDQPVTVVLDEFSYLLEAAPPLASIVQNALSPRSHAKTRTRTRLILCGSAITTMRGLLGGSAPLRGRATLELMVDPLGYRDAAEFWGVAHDPELAFRLHALVGGTPAYREMSFDAPMSAADFDGWVARRLLRPASAMFREGDVLLHEEPGLGDPALHYAVLAAISRGAHKRGEIATVLGRPDSALTYPLLMLEHTLLIERLDDAFRQKRPVYRIAEPLIRFHQLVIRPNEGRLVMRAEKQVWAEAADAVSSLIYGPHLEDLARRWCMEHASKETLGGVAGQVMPAVLACRKERSSHELDVVAIEARLSAADRVTAIGEVKATAVPMDTGAVERLEHIRGLLDPGKVDGPPKLLLFSRSGFTRGLRDLAKARDDVELIDLDRLYRGD